MLSQYHCYKQWLEKGDFGNQIRLNTNYILKLWKNNNKMAQFFLKNYGDGIKPNVAQISPWSTSLKN